MQSVYVCLQYNTIYIYRCAREIPASSSLSGRNCERSEKLKKEQGESTCIAKSREYKGIILNAPGVTRNIIYASSFSRQLFSFLSLRERECSESFSRVYIIQRKWRNDFSVIRAIMISVTFALRAFARKFVD